MEKILVVDDQQDIRRLLAITLGDKYQVIEANCATQALQLLESHHPKVVLLDVMMPGEIDGVAVLDVIKGNPEYQDVVVAMVGDSALKIQSDRMLNVLRRVDTSVFRS
jgi:CheY-like chemotaxis protein